MFEEKCPVVPTAVRELSRGLVTWKFSVVRREEFLWNGGRRRQTIICWKVNDSLYFISLWHTHALTHARTQTHWIRNREEEKENSDNSFKCSIQSIKAQILCVSRRAYLCVSLAHLGHIKNPYKGNCYIVKNPYSVLVTKSAWINPKRVYLM